MNKTVLAALAASAVFASSSAQAALPLYFNVSVEAPGITNTTTTFLGSGSSTQFGVETFDSRATGVSTFSTDFGGSPITGTYTGVNVINANQYGGAGNTGHYAVAGLGQTSSYSVKLTQTGSNGVNYFGYWLSALDAGNTVEFWSGGALLGTFNPSDVIAFVGGSGSPYYGNPATGEVAHEPFVFVNFYNTTGTFDEIVFKQTTTAGYESDNHTVGWYVQQGGTEVPAVPEPTTWAMMILGFGAVGGVMRASRRKTRTTLQYA